MRVLDFFDGAQSETTPTIGNIIASGIITYADDAAYEAAEVGAPINGNIYFNTTINQLRYYSDGAWSTVVDDDSLQTLINKTIDADSNTITNLEDDNIKAGAAINVTKLHDGSVDNTEFGYLNGITGPIQTQLDDKQNLSEKGTPNGYASLDGTGKVPATELPSYVDDVEEYANFAALPVTGESGKIYVTTDDNLTYRWTGSVYVAVGPQGGGSGDGVQLVGGGNKEWNPQAVTFNNTTSLTCPGGTGNGARISYNPTYFDQTNNISVSAWFKTGGSINSETLFSHMTTGTTTIKWAVQKDTSGKIAVAISDDGLTFKRVYESASSFDDDNWHHVVFTFSSGNLKLYIDGTELTTGNASLNQILDNACPSLFLNTNDLVIGGYDNTSTGTSSNWAGEIDEVSYWDKELNAFEIAEIYNNIGVVNDLSLHSASANLIEWWRNGDGDALPTITGQVNTQNATILGSSSFVVDAPPGINTGDFTFDAPIQIVLPGLPNFANNIPITESPISLNAGQVAHVSPNNSAPGGDLTVTVSAPQAVPDGNLIIMLNDESSLKYANVSETYPNVLSQNQIKPNIEVVGGGNKVWNDSVPFATDSFVGNGIAGNGAETTYNAAVHGQTNNISYFVWIKTADANATFGSIAGQGGQLGGDRKWYAGMNNGSLGVIVSSNGTSTSGSAKFYETNATYNTNAWVHFGFTFTTNSLKIYVNGSEVTGAARKDTITGTVNSLNPSVSNLVLNCLNPGLYNFAFNGKTAQHTYWSTELSAAEITELYNGGLAYDVNSHSQTTNLKFFYRVDGDTTVGGILTDFSSNALDATIVGSATIDDTDAPPSVSNGVFSFDSPLQIEVPGVAYSDNTILSSESPLIFTSNNQVAYVNPNLTSGGGALSVFIDDLQNVPNAGIVVARRDNQILSLGSSQRFPVKAPNKIQTKILTADVTSSGVVTDLGFSGLVVGNWYELRGKICAVVEDGASDEQINLSFVHDGVVLDDSLSTVNTSLNTIQTNSISVSFVFQATTTTLTAEVSSASVNSYICGNGNRVETYVQIEERNDLIETTDFT